MNIASNSIATSEDSARTTGRFGSQNRCPIQSRSVCSTTLLGGEGSDTYLGIQLDKMEVALSASGSVPITDGPSFWSKLGAALSDLAGKNADVPEGTGKSFTVYLNQAEKAGDTLTLALADGLADRFKAILGDSTVDANGAVMALVDGQTSVSFALVQQGCISADASTGLSVSYLGTDESATKLDAACAYSTRAKDQFGHRKTAHNDSNWRMAA